MQKKTETETRLQRNMRLAAEYAARQAVYAHESIEDAVMVYFFKNYHGITAFKETVALADKMALELQRERIFCMSLQKYDDIIRFCEGDELDDNAWKNCVTALIQAAMHGHGVSPDHETAETILHTSESYLEILRPALCNALAKPNLPHVGSRVIHQVFLRYLHPETDEP